MVAFASTSIITMDMLQKAFNHVANKHPMLRAVIKTKGTEAWFETRDDVIADIQEDTREDWVSACQEIQAKGFPDMLNLWHVKYMSAVISKYSCSKYKHQCTFIFTIHHSIADGVSLMRLMNEINIYIDNDLKGKNQVHEEPLPFPPSVETLMNVKYSSFACYFNIMYFNLQTLFNKIRNTRGTAQHKDNVIEFFCKSEKNKVSDKDKGVVIIPMQLTERESNIFITACKKNQVSPMAVFTAAFFLTSYDHMPIGDNEVQYCFPTNQRRLFPSKSHIQDHLALHISLVYTELDLPRCKPLLWDLAKICQRNAHNDMQKRERRWLEVINNMRKISSQGFYPLFFISNYGKFDFVEHGKEPCIKLAAVFSTALAGQSSAISITLVYFDNKLCWNFNYDASAISKHTANLMAHAIRRQLQDILK